MAANYPAPPPAQPSFLSSINWRSPLPYLIIGLGGFGLYLLYRRFMANSGTSTSSGGSTSPRAAFTEENVYLQTLESPPAVKTKGPPIRVSPGNPIPKRPHDPEANIRGDVPDVDKIPGPPVFTTAAPATEAPAPQPHGGGMPTSNDYLHVSTWPYGGQVMRTRLG